MPFGIGGNSRIRTNISALNAYNSLEVSNRDISNRQLRLSTGKRINNAADDVAGFITSRALLARNGALQASLKAVGDAQNTSYIIMDSLENISNLVENIRNSTASATSGVQGTAETVALAKAAARMVSQIQTIVDSTVFGGRQLIDGGFSAEFVIATDAVNNLITLALDMTSGNNEFNVSRGDFNLNSTQISNFAGITGLDMNKFDEVTAENLGIFESDVIGLTLVSLADAIENINKVASYVGGLVNRLISQEESLKGQIVNYKAAKIGRAHV